MPQPSSSWRACANFFPHVKSTRGFRLARRADDLRHQSGRMERKHVLMPPGLIRCIEAMAAEAKVSFGELVRRALWRYDFASERVDADATLEQLADALIKSNEETIAYVDKVNKNLDKAHGALAKHRHDASWFVEALRTGFVLNERVMDSPRTSSGRTMTCVRSIEGWSGSRRLQKLPIGKSGFGQTSLERRL